MTGLWIAAALLTIQSAPTLDAGPVTDPDFAPDGRLVFAVNGDLWIVATAPGPGASLTLGVPRQITAGDSWDREPAWFPDGRTVTFSSNRSGAFSLWRVQVLPDGSLDTPQPVPGAPENAGQPAVSRTGAIVFVAGVGSRADLWVLDPGSSVPRRLTRGDGEDVHPTVDPSGETVVFVSRGNGSTRLRRIPLAGGRVATVGSGRAFEYPVFSADGSRIAFTTRGGDPGVWVTPLDGSHTNFLSDGAAAPAWSPDGAHLVLAPLGPRDVGYNGNPARIGDREADVVTLLPSTLQVLDAPAPVSVARSVDVPVTYPRETLNARAFDAVWNRLATIYFPAGSPGHERWQTMRSEWRPRALSARSEEELQRVIFSLLRERPTIREEASGRAAVSSAHPLATAAGVQVLAAGGNVVDAAVAVSFALGVVEPDASGIGGYGEMVVSVKGMDRPVVIEFLTRVPEAASLSNAGLLEDGELPTDGPVLANVPGTVAGMYRAWERYGSGVVPWSDLVEPAIRIAEDGYVLDDAFTTTLERERERFLKYESSRALFFPDGEPLRAGDTFRNPDLAWTLRQIAERGADGFYRGPVADRLVRDLRGQGNAVTPQDLTRYFAVEREPVVGEYRGHTIYGAAPAVTGGVSLVSKLHLLDNVRLSLYTTSAPALHALIEAWKLQPSANGRVADPSLWPVDYDSLIDRDLARQRWDRCFNRDRSTTPEDLRPVDGGPRCGTDAATLSWGEDGLYCEDVGCRATGTTAFAVADADGNMVAVTQTLGTWGGNFYVTPGLGFLYNDKLRSYGSNPNGYNARIPFARNSTSISPTLVFKGTGRDQTPFLAVGAAGNAWITSAVYQVISGVLDGKLGPQRALELPRFLVSSRRDPGDPTGVREVLVQLEDGLAPDVERQLADMGHRFQKISLRGELRMGYGAAVVVDGGRATAGADPRRSGKAGAVR